MTLVSLNFPPGFHRTGTDLDSEGRWREGSLVRWKQGSLRPLGGWVERLDATGASITSFSEKPRSAHSWVDNTGDQRVAFGSANKVWSVLASGVVTDITPSGLTAGRVDALVATGYGTWYYGMGTYGSARPDTSTPLEATTWSLDNYGQTLIACASTDGTIYSWDLNTSNDLTAVTNAPTSCKGLVVTEQRQILALCPNGNNKKVAFSDVENITEWTDSTTNQAGSFELQTNGQILQAVRARGQIVILTTTDTFAARYLGPPLVMGFPRLSTGTGAISRQSAVTVDQTVFWMGETAFYRFDGASVQPVKCEVSDYIFANINDAQKSKIWGVNDVENQEVFWFYPSGDSTEIDKYVAFSYAEGHWLIGSLSRTAGVKMGVFSNPIYTDGSKIYDHETGFSYDGASVFAETAPIKIGAGDKLMKVNNIIPDEKTLGDVKITLKSRNYPTASETTSGPHTLVNPTNVRVQGRQVRMKVEGNQLTDWRVGNMRLDVVAGGSR